MSSLSANSPEKRQVHHFFCFREFGPSLCHKGRWRLSQVSDDSPCQVFVPLSETALLLFSFKQHGRSDKASALAGRWKQMLCCYSLSRVKYVFWRSVFGSLIVQSCSAGVQDENEKSGSENGCSVGPLKCLVQVKKPNHSMRKECSNKLSMWNVILSYFYFCGVTYTSIIVV